MKTKGKYFFKKLILAIGIFSITGCKTNDSVLKSQVMINNKYLNQIEQRIESIELHLGKSKGNRLEKIIQEPEGPIKSVTLRLGTKDDRLRIYWADGTNSDLPCTKEQSIWVCG